MKSKLLLSTVTSSLILLATASHAILLNSKPEKCPDKRALIAAGFDFAVDAGDGTWIADKTARYGTKETWAFIARGFKGAKDESDAIHKAKKALLSLHLVSGPKLIGDKWQCNYTMDFGDEAMAIVQS